MLLTGRLAESPLLLGTLDVITLLALELRLTKERTINLFEYSSYWNKPINILLEAFQTIGLTIITPILSSKTTPINGKRAFLTRRNKILMVFTLDTEENAKRLAEILA